MKRLPRICLLVTALGFALATEAQETNKTKPKLAVLPFQNKAGNAWWYYGGAETAQDVFVTELMKALQDVFVTELMNAKRFAVVPPSALDAGFTLSDDLVNEAKSEKALTLDLDVLALSKRAKDLGINYLLTGAVTEYGVTDKSAGKRRNLAVALQAKLIDTSTGEIVWADEARHVQQVSVGGFGGGVDDVRVFKKTVKPCVDRLFMKWRASRRLDWQHAK